MLESFHGIPGFRLLLHPLHVNSESEVDGNLAMNNGNVALASTAGGGRRKKTNNIASHQQAAVGPPAATKNNKAGLLERQ